MNKEITPFDDTFDRVQEIVTDPSAEPVRYSDILQSIGLPTHQVKASDLVGKEITILRAKPFQSSFKEGEQAYYCHVRIDETPEVIGVVIGGAACVEILEALARTLITNPIKVTLNWSEGGNFSGYYFFS